MKYTLLFLSAVVSLQAAVDFVPNFKDKPVPEEDIVKIEEALPDAPIVRPAAKRRVLVVSSTSGYRHSSIATGKIAIEKLGAETGAYEAVISDDPANFEPEVLKTFDTVLLMNTTLDFFMPNERRQKKKYTDEEWAELQDRHNRLIDNLIDYVEQGGGLAGIHAATDTCYNHKEFGETMGGYFDGHPWGAKSNVTIVVEDPSHAINQPVFGSIKDFGLKEEIYQFKPEPYTRDRLRILLHLDPERSDDVKGKKREDNDYPVAWVQAVGKGRVFYTSIGHNHNMFWNPLILKHYLAGLQFTCGDLEADVTPSNHVSMPSVKKNVTAGSCCSTESH